MGIGAFVIDDSPCLAVWRRERSSQGITLLSAGAVME